MGWIDDLWKKFTDWVRATLANALAWIVTKINDFTVWLKVTRHKFNLWLADFANTTLGFWLTLGGIVVVVLGIVFVTRSGWAAKAKLAIAAFLAKVKVGTATILEILHYSEIYSLNEIAKIVIPGYRDMWTAFYKAMGALAEEIGLGVGTITAFLRNANNLIISTYMSIGYTGDEAEVIYMRDSNEFFSKVDGRFEQYARDPESIFTDINNELVRPHLEAGAEKDYKLALALNSLTDTVIEKDAQITDIEDNMKTLIDDLPDELDEAISKRTDVFFTKIDDFRDEFITPTLEKLNSIRNVVNDYIATQEKQRIVWNTLLSSPADFFAQIETLSPEERNRQRILLEQLISSLNLRGMGNVQDELLSLPGSQEREILPPLPISTEPDIKERPEATLIIRPEEITSSIGSWFVGEY